MTFASFLLLSKMSTFGKEFSYTGFDLHLAISTPTYGKLLKLHL